MGEQFGTAPDGTQVQKLVIERDGLRAALITQGAVLQDLRLAGHDAPLVLGYPDLHPYLDIPNYFGATIGRVANRLRHGQVKVAGNSHQLDINAPHGHHIHGGRDGTANRNWSVSDSSLSHASFQTQLAHGHMGYPGTLDVQVHYRILPAQTLEIEIVATTDAPTLCNFAHHSYFNLDGAPTISGHRLKVLADSYVPVTPDGIPTGEITDVAETGFDFRSGRVLGESPIYDHNLCLSGQRRDITQVAELTGGNQAVTMMLATSEPGLQVYCGQGIATGGAAGLNGMAYGPCAGIALEPQIWPDAPNHRGFPSAQLNPDQTYRQVTQFSFRKLEP